MKAFQFRLEKVRKVRETQRRQSQAQFMDERRRLAEEVGRLTTRRHERQRAEQMYSGSAKGTTRAGRLLAARYYLSAAEVEVLRQRKNVFTAEERAEVARLDLVEKTKDKKVLDRLRERRLTEYHITAQREKQKQIDDTARQNYFRRHPRKG